MNKPELVDTHAHVHFRESADSPAELIRRAGEAGVTRIVTVGTDIGDSGEAVKLAEAHDSVWATIGLHPHEAGGGVAVLAAFEELIKRPKVVAVGECGLDFYRNLASPADQEAVFRAQIELALAHHKPMVWHVREAFDDFFRIVDEYSGVRGVVHCFTSHQADAERAVERGFYVALNGIMTFTKDAGQLEAARWIPPEHLLLETDCPFLTPEPHRGQPNEPANIAIIARFLANLRGEAYADLARQTTANAVKLFNLE